MFVQIHMLQSVPPGNLNRDGTGQPKKCIFGGVTRGRISSQCLKRNIRLSQLFQDEFGGITANRTKYLPRLVGDALLEAGVIPDEEIEGVKAGIAAQFKKETKSEEEKTKESESSSSDVTPQLVFFPPPFAMKVADLVTELREQHPKAYGKLIGRKEKRSKDEDKEADAAIAAFRDAAFNAKESMSVDVGLFGRMTTSDIIANVEAACQVAHAISTHEALTEGDYFTAIDDLQGKYMTSQVDSKGAGFVGSADDALFNSAVYYKYFNVDTDALAVHLGPGHVGQAHHAAAVLLQAAALATPTGKQNSFAAHSVPEVILVEVSEKKQPVSYANAFLEAVHGDDLMQESAKALSDYCGSIAAAFAPPDTQRFLLAIGNAGGVSFSFDADRKASLVELAAAVEAAVSQQAGAQ